MTELNFDKASRFEALDALINTLPEILADDAILDIGGYPGDFADYCQDSRKVVTVDIPPCDRASYVQASGENLPFADGEFPIVVSSDTLEHIPRENRAKFLTEAMRCASQYVIIGCPWGHPAVTYCEDALRGIHQMLYPTPHPWLDEHGRFGLPELEETLGGLRQAGAHDTALIPNMTLIPWFYHHAWSILGGAFAPVASMPDAAAALISNSPTTDTGAASPHYRLFYVAAKSGLLPASFHKRSRAALAANNKLFELEMEKLRIMAQAFRSCAAGMSNRLGDSPSNEDAPSIDEAYVRRLEDLINKTQRETSQLRRDLARTSKQLRQLKRHPIVRIFRRLGLLG